MEYSDYLHRVGKYESQTPTKFEFSVSEPKKFIPILGDYISQNTFQS